MPQPNLNRIEPVILDGLQSETERWAETCRRREYLEREMGNLAMRSPVSESRRRTS